MNFLLVIHVVLLTYHSGPGEVVLWRWAYYRHAFPLHATHNISFCILQPYPPRKSPVFSDLWVLFSYFYFFTFSYCQTDKYLLFSFLFLFFWYLCVFLPLLLPWPYNFLILPYFLYPCFRYSCNIFKSIEKTYGAFSRITFLHFHILACQEKAKLL